MSSITAHLSDQALHRRIAPLAAAGLLGIAAVHLIDGPGSFSDTAYVGVLEFALVALTVPLAMMLLVRPVRVLWELAGGIPLLALLVFLASRTVGLPGATDDIGNWAQMLGIVNVAFELLVLGAVIAGLRVTAAPSLG